MTMLATTGWFGRGLILQRGGPATVMPGGTVSAGLVTAAGHGWTTAGIEGAIPAAGSCHYGHAGGGELLPDPRCTPGAIDTAVRSSTLRSTVCRPGGYTATVRPPEAITEAVKRELMAAYGIPWRQASNYELDHLVELAAGGASDVRNLWPEPNVFLNSSTGSAFVHNDKDAVEAYTFHALCAGRVQLGALQRAVATNWTTAITALGLAPIPAGYRG
jgi:hypothetical protein